MASFIGQLGLVCLIAGIIGGWLVQWQTALLAIPIINLGLGFTLTLTWIVRDFIPAVKSGAKETVVQKTRNISFSTLYSLVVVGVIVYLNFLFSGFDYYVDLTKNRLYSISEKTIEIAKGLQNHLKIIVPETPDVREIVSGFRDIVKQIQKHTDKVELLVFNPYAKQNLLKSYDLNPGDVGVLVLEKDLGDGQKATKKIKLQSLSEQGLLSSYNKLISDRSTKLGYVVGHGELDMETPNPESGSGFIQLLKQEGFEVVAVNLIGQKQIPSDLGGLLVVGPQKAFLDSEIDTINQYIDNGGRVLIAVDFFGEVGSLQRIASKVGIEIGENLVVDPVQTLGGIVDIVSNDFGPHRVTKGFSQSRLVVMPYSVSVDAKRSVKLGGSENAVIGTNIINASKASWVEKNLSRDNVKNVTQIKFDSGIDPRGPIPIASVFDYYIDQEGQKQAKVVIFGSSKMFSNAFLPLFHNSDLILASINWLLDYFDSGAERPKGYVRSITPVPDNVRSKYILLFLLLPQMIIAFGLFVKFKRNSA